MTPVMHCGKEMKLNESCNMYICQNEACYVTHMIMMVEKTTDDDKIINSTVKKIPRRTSQFRNMLLQQFSKDNEEIPQKVYDEIRSYMKTHGIKTKKLTGAKLKNILKQ